MKPERKIPETSVDDDGRAVCASRRRARRLGASQVSFGSGGILERELIGFIDRELATGIDRSSLE